MDYVEGLNLSIAYIEDNLFEDSSVCFTVDCVDPENEAWEQMSEWCKKNVPDRTVRRYVGTDYQEHL